MIKPNVNNLVTFFEENGRKISRIKDLPRESGLYLVAFEGGDSPAELCTLGRSSYLYHRALRLMPGSALYNHWNAGQRHLKAFHLVAMQKLLPQKWLTYRVITTQKHRKMEQELRNVFLGGRTEILTSLSHHTESKPAGRDLLSKLMLSYSGPTLNDTFVDLLECSYKDATVFWKLLHGFKRDFRRFFGNHFFPYGKNMEWWYERHGLRYKES